MAFGQDGNINTQTDLARCEGLFKSHDRPFLDTIIECANALPSIK